MIDIHSHVLPGIDDGSPDLNTSIELCKGLVDLGFTAVVATPHVISDTHPNTSETILSAYSLLKNELEVLNIPIALTAAAEYMLEDELLTLVDADSALLSVNGDKILTEFSYAVEPDNINNYSFNLQLASYELILAHPERYPYWHGDFKQYTRLKDWGFEFQVNALSLTPYYGKQVQKMANDLLNKGFIDYIGTDIHHLRHLAALKDFYGNSGFKELIKKYKLKNEQFLA